MGKLSPRPGSAKQSDRIFEVYDPQMPDQTLILQMIADELRHRRQKGMDPLKQLCEEQLAVRYRVEDRPRVNQRLSQELQTIQTNGQADAFEEARSKVQVLSEQGYCCRMIGAGCSSLVSYLMNLSEVDPIEHGLPYERFLTTNSTGMIQFMFVADWQTDMSGKVFSPIQDGLFSDAVRIHPSTALEAMPGLVVRAIRVTKPDFHLSAIPWNDEATFETLRSGNVDGVSQFERVESQRTLLDLKPRSLLDIAITTALKAIQFRDAHENGTLSEYVRRGVPNAHQTPENWLVTETLQDTRGMMLFQEQIMLILNRVADIPLADAYDFIKAVCKRQMEPVAAIRVLFVIRATENGVNEADAQSLFEKIRDAATRAVCKSHHLSEAITTYHAAFLKTHFPTEFSKVLQIIQR